MNIPCIACGHTETRRLRPYRNQGKYGRRLFGAAWLEECRGCGLVQVAPRPTPHALSEYYERDYRKAAYTGIDVADSSTFPRDNMYYYNRGASIAELVSKYVTTPKPRVLDIGAGFGHVLHAIGERMPGSALSAIEFSDVCVRHLRSLGVDVFSRPVEEVLPDMEGRFDVVVLSHVFEHLLNPPEVLELISGSLVPGGILYIEVPNIPADSLLKYPDHKWAPRWDEPHITFFSQATLVRMIGSAGYQLLFADAAGPQYRYISALRFRLPPLRGFVQRFVPRRLFLALRKRRFTERLRVHDREDEFYRYGGFRIWIRTVWRTKGVAEAGGDGAASARSSVAQ